MKSSIPLRYRGPLGQAPRRAISRLMDRCRDEDEGVALTVSSVIEAVRDGKDAALRAMARELYGVVLEQLEVSAERWRAALDHLSPACLDAMEQLRRNLEAIHRAMLPQPVEVEILPGVRVGRRPDPLQRVGLHAPAGGASRASTVLAMAVAARVAGVGETVLCCAPERDGLPPKTVLAAAALAGVNRLFAVGGAAAIAAMAYGTETVPRVDGIAGPGDKYVTEAKRQLSGRVVTDAGCGPSELLAVLDGTADVRWVAAELAAAVESDPECIVVALVLGTDTEARLLAALQELLESCPQREVVMRTLATTGAAFSVGSVDEALDFAAAFAPQRLLLAVQEAEAWLPAVRNTAAVLLGAGASVTSGSYLGGANELLPSGGRARSFGGLGTDFFMRWTSVQQFSRAAALALARGSLALLEAEGVHSYTLAKLLDQQD